MAVGEAQDGPSRRRKAGPTALAELVGDSLAPVLRKQGFVSSDLIVHWDQIVGAELARWSEPLEIRWPRRRQQADPEAAPETASLSVRVDGAHALEFDYARALIIERINAHFGWRCIGKIVIKQGVVGARAAPPPRRPALSEAGRERLEAMTEGAEPALQKALQRLGRSVLAEAESRKP